MSWFLNSVPYILAGATILVAFLQVIKEWDEYDKNPRLQRVRIAVLVSLIVIGALTFVSLHLDDTAKAEEKNKAEGDIRDLQGKVQAANDAQRDNTKLFVDSFGAMSKEVSNLKAEVKTEALQKKLATVEAELQKTQKAMAPGPKAKLSFTFVPYLNPPIGQNVVRSTDVTLPIKPDGSVHVEFTVLNETEVEATNTELQIQICDGCKYAKEPEGLQKLTGMTDTQRYLLLPHMQPLQAYKTISLDIIPPPLPLPLSFPVGFIYRCTTCVLQKNAVAGTVHISRP